MGDGEEDEECWEGGLINISFHAGYCLAYGIGGVLFYGLLVSCDGVLCIIGAFIVRAYSKETIYNLRCWK